jgi:hypothetical protein
LPFRTTVVPEARLAEACYTAPPEAGGGPAPGRACLPSTVASRAPAGADSKRAVTSRGSSIRTAQLPAAGSESQPLQPAKALPAAALAFSTTVAPASNSPAQTGPQEIAAGTLVTVP